MIQIFMVFPSKVGAPGHVSGMCSSLWTTSFAIVLICLTSRRSPAEESETPPSVVERCLCPQVDDSEPQQTGEPGEQVCRRALRKLRRRHMLRRPR